MAKRRLTFPTLRWTAGLALSLAWSALAQMQTGEQMKDYHTELGLGDVAHFETILLEANAPANIFWPGERPQLRFQVRHRAADAWKAAGHVEVVEWSTESIPEDIWLPQVRKRGVPFIPARLRDGHHGRQMESIEQELRQLHAANVTVLAEFEAGPAAMPLGRGRPHLDENATMRDGKEDLAWLPTEDPAFYACCVTGTFTASWPKPFTRPRRSSTCGCSWAVATLRATPGTSSFPTAATAPRCG